MKHIFAALLALSLTGCANLGFNGLTASQIKATNGTITCENYAGLYGKASAIALNADDVRKGATSKGKTTISCGDAQMVIEVDTGVAGAVPVQTTTTGTSTMTTVVKPAP